MMPQPPGGQPATERPVRPPDVDTAFWLWVIALPLMVIAYIIEVITGASGVVGYAISAVFLVVLTSIVVTFLILMRQGYRWTRTLLTGGGFASGVYMVTGLFTAQRDMPEALIYAVAGIAGTVLIAGGIFLLHRKDSHAFFTR